jgi:hypothetical protein
VVEIEECDRQLADIEPQRAELAKGLEGLLEQRHEADRHATHWRTLQNKQMEKLDLAKAELDVKQREATVRVGLQV